MRKSRLGRDACKKKWNKAGFIILFLTPLMAAFCIFYLYPLISVFLTSFCKWDYSNIQKPEFWGWKEMFKNYDYIFNTYPFFWESLGNSLKWAMLGIFFHVPLATAMALTLSREMKGMKVVQIIYVIPCMISAAALAMTFQQLYNPQYGALNALIRVFNPDFQGNILLTEGKAFWAVTSVSIFYTGTTTLMLQGNISAIPMEVREAALLDGASGIKQDLYIVLPMLKNTLKTACILAGTSGFLLYNEVYFMTKGAAGTYSLSYVIRELAINSPRSQFGRANAVSLLLIIGGCLLILFINLLFELPERLGRRSGKC